MMFERLGAAPTDKAVLNGETSLIVEDMNSKPELVLPKADAYCDLSALE